MPQAGQRIKALDFTAAVKAEDSTLQTNISTTLGSGSPEVSVTFVAPTSGKAQIIVSASTSDDVSNDNPAVIDWQLYLGTNSSGTLILGTGSLQRRLVLMPGTIASQSQELSHSYVATGLTAGSTYFVRIQQQAWAGTSLDVHTRALTVIPLPA